MNLKPFIAALYIFLCHTLSAATPDTLVVAVEAKANPGQAPEVAFARKLANHLNTQFEPYLCPWARCLKAIETGDADIILSVFETQDRKAAMAFVEPALAEHVIRFEFLQKKGKSISISLRELIKVDTLTVTHENKSISTVAFDVNTKPLGIDASGKLAGELRYNNQLAYIEAINVTNTETFSPMFSAEITDLDVLLEFSLFNDDVVILKQTMEMKGSYAFFVEIEEVSTATYSDYKLLF